MIYGIPKTLADRCAAVAEELFEYKRDVFLSKRSYSPLPRIRGVMFNYVHENSHAESRVIAELYGVKKDRVNKAIALHEDRMTGERMYKESYEAFCAAYHDKFEEPKLPQKE